MKTALYIATALLFMVIGVFFGVYKYRTTEPSSTAATALFAQTLPDIHGKPQPLAQWKSKILIVNFWATWCAPCMEEMPELSAMQTGIAKQNVQIIGIGIDTAANIAQFSTKYKIAYPLYNAGVEGTNLIRHFGNPSGGLPFTLLIGADGTVKKTYLGRLKFDELRRDLAAL